MGAGIRRGVAFLRIGGSPSYAAVRVLAGAIEDAERISV